MDEPKKVIQEKRPAKAKVISPLFQILFIMISILLIGASVYRRFFIFRAHEEKLPLKIITPKQIAEYGDYPAIVTVGLSVDQFQKFDLVANEFIFAGIIWFLFNPGDISLETLDKFSFQRGEILSKSPPDTQLLDQKLLVKYNIKVKFTSPLDYRAFPLDDHQIYIVFEHHFISPGEVLLESSQREFEVTADVKTLGWDKINQSVRAGYLTSELDPHDERKTRNYPVIIFQVDYDRYGMRYVITILLPLLLIFYLTLFSLSVTPAAGIRIAVGGVSATITYRFVIERLSPEVGYFMLSDYLFLLFLAANFLVFIANLFAAQISLWQKKVALIIMHICVDLVSLYLILIRF